MIHTDFLQKFIRAQVYSFDDLMEYRSEAAIKAAGKMRVEGKAYVLQDGDVCHFLIGNQGGCERELAARRGTAELEFFLPEFGARIEGLDARSTRFDASCAGTEA